MDHSPITIFNGLFWVVCSGVVLSSQPLSDWLGNWPTCSLIGRSIGLIWEEKTKRNCTRFLLQGGRANGVSGPSCWMPLSSISDHVLCWSNLFQVVFADLPGRIFQTGHIFGGWAIAADNMVDASVINIRSCLLLIKPFPSCICQFAR